MVPRRSRSTPSLSDYGASGPQGRGRVSCPPGRGISGSDFPSPVRESASKDTDGQGCVTRTGPVSEDEEVGGLYREEVT